MRLVNRTLLGIGMVVGLWALAAGDARGLGLADLQELVVGRAQGDPPDESPPEVGRAVDGGAIGTVVLDLVAPLRDQAWIAQGPGPTLNGQVENLLPGGEVVGAVHTVVAHPSDPNVLYVGGTNGGIWKTENAQDTSPHWVSQIDSLASLSIGALDMDPTDSQSLVAGIGHASSYGRLGGPLNGLLITHDGGASWTALTDPILVGENMTGVALRGSLVLASANAFGGGAGGGLFRSTDGGASWTTISGSGGLPNDAVFDLVRDPTNTTRYYCSVDDDGIYRSDDAGLTWTNISQNDPVTLEPVIQGGGNNNLEMAVAPTNGRLFAAVIINGRPMYIGYTDDQGGTWTAMDLPQTMESNGDVEGLSPKEKPGGQGSIHFSILVDPTDETIVYAGGDRQDSPFPNFIGAVNFTGRLFRGDTTVTPTAGVPSPQWEHMTHLDTIVAIPGGGTPSSSAPHADSREMAFDALGNLIETDDGGIYRRESPRDNLGDWFSIIGDLQTTEMHNVAYDSVSKLLIGGAQDTGTPEQLTSGSLTWDSVSTADGGDVAVDDTTTPGQSVRYSSFQFLISFRRRTYDANNVLLVQEFPDLDVIGGGADFEGQFTTPVVLNLIDQQRMILVGGNSIYESLDRGDTLEEIGPGLGGGGFVQNAVAYGGYRNQVANEDVLYVGVDGDVYVRTVAAGPLALTVTPFPGGDDVGDVSIDGRDWMRALVCDPDQVYVTDDAGTSWTDITGNLTAQGATNFRSLAFVQTRTRGLDLFVVGTNAGVFASLRRDLGTWLPLGSDLPHAPVWDLDYDRRDDVLVAATLGRGAWLLENVGKTDRLRSKKRPR